MLVGSSTMMGAGRILMRSALQWAPTLQTHDPSNVLTLLDPDPPPAATDVFHEQVIGGIERGMRAVTAAGLGGVLVT